MIECNYSDYIFKEGFRLSRQTSTGRVYSKSLTQVWSDNTHLINLDTSFAVVKQMVDRSNKVDLITLDIMINNINKLK
jgi:hypothetical protein